MNWERTKSFIIFFLILLNILLISLHFISSKPYALPRSRQKTISSVLRTNNIQINAKIPTKYPPTKKLLLSNKLIDENSFITLFNLNPNKLKVKNTATKKIITDGTGKSITIKDNKLIYEASSRKASHVTVEQAIDICENTMGSSKTLFPGFILDSKPQSTRTAIILSYRQKHGVLIFSNYAKFTIMNGEIIKMEYSLSPPTSYLPPKHDISPPDKVLLVFMQHLMTSYDYDDIIITKMDKVYCTEDTNEPQDKTAIPCYRIDFTDKQGNHYNPIIINAYTCKIIDYQSQ